MSWNNSNFWKVVASVLSPISNAWSLDVSGVTSLTLPGAFVGGDLNFSYGSQSVIDEGTIDIPSSISGWGTVMVGDNEEFVRFRWTTAGAVTLMENTENVVSTDTDTKFCVFDNGSKVTLRNRLGSTKVVKYLLNY